jgi:hypothetical protein
MKMSKDLAERLHDATKWRYDQPKHKYSLRFMLMRVPPGMFSLMRLETDKKPMWSADYYINRHDQTEYIARTPEDAVGGLLLQIVRGKQVTSV